MEFDVVGSLSARKHADIIVIPFWKEDKKTKPAVALGPLKDAVELPLDSGDFSGKEGELLLVYSKGGSEKRIALLGLGEEKKVSAEGLRRAYASVSSICQQKKLTSLNLPLPSAPFLHHDTVVKAISEGILLTNYVFEGHMCEKVKEKGTVLLKKINFIGSSKDILAVVRETYQVCESVYMARDLINSNADLTTPQYLCEVAKSLSKKYRALKTTVFNKKRLEKEKMGLLLAVGQGSAVDPALIIIEYKGNPKSKEHTVMVGKGVTYDTGGLNLKPTGSMETMKCDMSGAAAVLGTMKAIASLGLKVNVTGVIPSTENCISDRSYKPGDVYTSYAGITVEIGNTDAEGRLILADALAYAVKKLKPTRIIDFATLTGAIVIALGHEAAGLMSNDDTLAKELIHAGDKCFERLWRLPLYEEYKSQLDSDVADIKNVGGRDAGSITAAHFLQKFVGEIPWAHIDIAGTAFLPKGRAYLPKNATGIGVRLMVDLLK